METNIKIAQVCFNLVGLFEKKFNINLIFLTN